MTTPPVSRPGSIAVPNSTPKDLALSKKEAQQPESVVPGTGKMDPSVSLPLTAPKMSGPQIAGQPCSAELAALWGATKEIHDLVESIGFRKRVMKGEEESPNAWVGYLADLHIIYFWIEETVSKNHKELPVAFD